MKISKKVTLNSSEDIIDKVLNKEWFCDFVVELVFDSLDCTPSTSDLDSVSLDVDYGIYTMSDEISIEFVFSMNGRVDIIKDVVLFLLRKKTSDYSIKTLEGELNFLLSQASKSADLKG